MKTMLGRLLHIFCVLLLLKESYSKLIWKMSGDLSKEWSHDRLKAFESGQLAIEEGEAIEWVEEAEMEEPAESTVCHLACSVPTISRISCEYEGKSEKKCVAHNCCWDPNTTEGSSCFKKDPTLCEQATCPSVPPNKRVECQALLDEPINLSNEDACNAAQCCWDPFTSMFLACYDKYVKKPEAEDCKNVQLKMRMDCGWPLISEDQCLNRGCCFDSSTSKSPWCFYLNNTVQNNINNKLVTATKPTPVENAANLTTSNDNVGTNGDIGTTQPVLSVDPQDKLDHSQSSAKPRKSLQITNKTSNAPSTTQLPITTTNLTQSTTNTSMLNQSTTTTPILPQSTTTTPISTHSTTTTPISTQSTTTTPISTQSTTTTPISTQSTTTTPISTHSTTTTSISTQSTTTTPISTHSTTTTPISTHSTTTTPISTHSTTTTPISTQTTTSIPLSTQSTTPLLPRVTTQLNNQPIEHYFTREFPVMSSTMFSSLRMVTTTPILPTQTITARTTITPLFPSQPPSFSISDARTPPANSTNSQDSSTPWVLPVPTKMPIASQSTASGGNFVETSWDRNRILCLLGNTQLCSLVLIAQAQPAQLPITNIQKPITTNNNPVPNKSFGNSNYHSNILKVQTQPKSMPANRSITTVQNKTVQSNPYSGLWSMCNTMKMLNMVQRDLIKICSFAEMYGPNGFSLPSSQDIEQVLSGSNDLNAVGTSTNPVGSVQFARNLLGLATGTATKNECSRAQRLYDRSKFRISCTSAANPKNEAECVLAGCCWLHSYNTYLINLLNIDASKNPLLSYLLNPNGNLGVSWQCVSPMNDATLNMLYTVTAVSEAQNILNNQNNQPVQSTPNAQNSLSQRRTQYTDEEHSSQGSNLSMRCTNVVSRVDCGESEWDKCVQRGCCWVQTPGQPDCFLPAN